MRLLILLVKFVLNCCFLGWLVVCFIYRLDADCWLRFLFVDILNGIVSFTYFEEMVVVIVDFCIPTPNFSLSV